VTAAAANPQSLFPNSEPANNQQPITNNQQPITNNQQPAPSNPGAFHFALTNDISS
jgi:hypothetical protein